MIVVGEKDVPYLKMPKEERGNMYQYAREIIRFLRVGLRNE